MYVNTAVRAKRSNNVFDVFSRKIYYSYQQRIKDNKIDSWMYVIRSHTNYSELFLIVPFPRLFTYIYTGRRFSQAMYTNNNILASATAVCNALDIYHCSTSRFTRPKNNYWGWVYECRVKQTGTWQPPAGNMNIVII